MLVTFNYIKLFAFSFLISVRIKFADQMLICLLERLTPYETKCPLWTGSGTGSVNKRQLPKFVSQQTLLWICKITEEHETDKYLHTY